jgi:hypothetical protein
MTIILDKIFKLQFWIWRYHLNYVGLRRFLVKHLNEEEKAYFFNACVFLVKAQNAYLQKKNQ